MHLTQLVKNNLPVIYKLLVDILFLLLMFFALSLIADNLISGIVSTHISFLKILFFITIDLIALGAVGGAAKINLIEKSPNKKTITLLAILTAALIFNGLFRLNLYLAFFIMFLALGSEFFLYKLFFEK